MNREDPAITRESVDLEALQRIDPRLVALALGRIDATELEELMARAVREPAIKRAVDAYWSLDKASKERSFSRAQDLLAGVHRARRPHWALMFLPTGLAGLMTGLLVVFVGFALRAPPLPDYSLEVRGGLRTMRSARSDFVVGRLAPTAPLELIMRPSRPIEGRASAAIFRVGSRDLVRLDSVPEVSESGSVRWRGTIDTLLPGELGAVELILAVRAGRRRPTSADVRQALRKTSPTLRLAKTTLVVDDS